MRKTIHQNVLTIDKICANYRTHDNYHKTVDMSNVKTFAQAKNVYDELMSFIQEIADNGSEGTFLTGSYHQFIIDGIKAAIGINLDVSNTVNEEQVGDMRADVQKALEESLRLIIESLHANLRGKELERHEVDPILVQVMFDFRERCEAG